MQPKSVHWQHQQNDLPILIPQTCCNSSSVLQLYPATYAWPSLPAATINQLCVADTATYNPLFLFDIVHGLLQCDAGTVFVPML